MYHLSFQRASGLFVVWSAEENNISKRNLPPLNSTPPKSIDKQFSCQSVDGGGQRLNRDGCIEEVSINKKVDTCEKCVCV